MKAFVSHFCKTAAIALLISAAATVRAQNIAPGQMITPTNTFTVADLGTLVVQRQDTRTLTFGGLTLNYCASSAVYRNSDGTLDFLYQVCNLNSNNSINRFAAAIFPFDTVTDISYSFDDIDGTDGVFSSGVRASGMVDRGASGSPIGFNFSNESGGQLQVGENSTIMRVRTNTNTYSNGTISVINGVASTVGSYAPGAFLAITAAPEPSALLMTMPVLCGLGIVVRRRTPRA